MSQFEKVIIPALTLYPIAGEGIGWNGDLYVTNRGDTPVAYFPSYVYTSQGPVFGSIPAHASADLFLSWIGHFGEYAFPPIPARLLYIERSGSDSLALHLDVHSTSSADSDWDKHRTELRIVRERDLRTGPIDLVAVTARADFRRRLRVYDPDRTAGAAVIVRLFTVDLTKPLGERLIPLTVVTGTGVYQGDETFPGYADVDIDRNFPKELASLDGGKLDIEVVPVTPNLRIWAMATATSNETQHVTTYTPQ